MKNLRCNSLDQHILYDLPWERNQQKSPRKPFNQELPENLKWQNASICYIPERKLRHAACNLLFLKTSTLRSQYQICLPVLVGQPIPLSVHKLPFFQAISRVHCQILKFASESWKITNRIQCAGTKSDSWRRGRSGQQSARCRSQVNTSLSVW